MAASDKNELTRSSNTINTPPQGKEV